MDGLLFDTRYTYKAAVQHFYVMNDIIMNWRKISKFVGKRERRNKDRAWNYDEIKKMLEKADERLRIVILLMASTGMRIGGVPTVRIGDLKKLADYRIYQIQVYSGEREEYTTFCSPECAGAIDSYIDFRIRCGEEKDPQDQNKLKARAPLVREMFDTRDPFKAKHPRTVSEYTLAESLRILAIKAGVRVPVTVGEYRKGSIRHDVAIDNGA
jgi:integrase